MPELGKGTELIFVEGRIERQHLRRDRGDDGQAPGAEDKLLRQTGKGKGDAVRLGFANATGDILMILDADLTVPPEDLPRFYEAIRSGKGEFINGVRLVYPMQKRPMRFMNLIGQQVLQPGVFVAARAVDQGHAVRDEGAVGARTTSCSRRTGTISASSIRSAISICSSAPRARTSTSPTCRSAIGSGPTARPTSSDSARAPAASDAGVRGPAAQVRVMPGFGPPRGVLGDRRGPLDARRGLGLGASMSLGGARMPEPTPLASATPSVKDVL